MTSILGTLSLLKKKQCIAGLGVVHFQVFRLALGFFQRKFAACSKPPSRGNHHKGPYPKPQERDQSGG